MDPAGEPRAVPGTTAGCRLHYHRFAWVGEDLIENLALESGGGEGVQSRRDEPERHHLTVCDDKHSRTVFCEVGEALAEL